MKYQIHFPRKIFISIATLSFIMLLGNNNFSNEFKLSKSVQAELNVKPDNEKTLVWIEFKDKGNDAISRLSSPGTFLTQLSIERRKKVKPLNALVDYSDIPVNVNYIEELKNTGIEIKNKSKWFNRVSCFVTKVQIEQIVNYDFVSKIDLVRTFKKNPDDIELNTSDKENISSESDNNGNPNEVQYQLNYGSSLTQMDIINCPMAHDSGYKGQGVLMHHLMQDLII